MTVYALYIRYSNFIIRPIILNRSSDIKFFIISILLHKYIKIQLQA